MPRRRKSGFDPEPFTVRWHSVANMATPSADIMSSPDPLTDAVDSSMIPPSSTRRVTRSTQRSDRFASLGTSPRKQMFELEVGDDQAPQKLLVTVETEDPGATAGRGSARRKLFQTSSPLLPLSRRREMATTTTVPLKKAIEEEVADPNATPRKRGRPRKTNGTPLPGAGTKRKSGTPMKRTPRRPRTTKTTDTAVESSGPKAQPTPGSKRRGRPPKNRAVEPSSELGTELNSGITSTARGRRRQAPEELLQVTSEANEAAELPPLGADDSQADNEMTLIITPSEAEGIRQQVNQASDNAQNAEPDSDIWMATLDDEPTPRPANRTEQADPASSIPDHEPEAENSQFEDYGYLGPGGSDASSVDEPRSEDRPGDNDTVAAGEDFSMIFMDSLPSLQANLRSSVQEITENDIGEETSMIINNTLESLRRSLQDRDKPGMDPEATEAPEPSPHALSQPQEEPVQSSIRPPLTFSPNRNTSPRWLRSPRRAGSSPLRHQVLKLNARETADSSPALPREDEAPPSSEPRGSLVRHDQDESNLYDDSFSEIPEDVLEAASPRRPLRLSRDEALEEEDVEMEDAQLIQPEEENQIQDEQDEREEQEEQHGPPTASNASGVSRSDAGRLPTPDDTPPQIEVADESPEKSMQESQASARSASSRSSSPMVPSPGIVSVGEAQIVPENVEQFADDDIVVIEDDPVENTSDEDEDLPEIDEPQQQELSLDKEVHHPEVTPVNQLTSPLQEPRSILPEVVSEKVLRPQLSPIVRAGRALQSVTSDPPSPEAREHQLRSPFRSSASRELGPRETQSSRHISTSPGKSLAFPAVTQIPPADEVYDDPFGSGTRHTGQASFMEALERSGGDPSPRRARATSKDSTASSTRFQPRSEDEMSWVANEGPISANLRGDVPLEAFARPSVPSISHAQFDGAANEADDEGADEMDIWEFEAQRAAPRSSHLQSPQKRTRAPPVQRRNTLPSPWTKQANTGTRRDSAVVHPARPEPRNEPAPDVDVMAEPAPETEETEEYSLLTQRENAQHQEKAPESAARVNRFDLSNFFSSPAAIPGMLAEKFLPAKMSGFGARPTEPDPEPEPQLTETEHTIPTSSMFPQVPQKEFRPRANSRTDLFSPVRPSAQVSTREEHETPERGARPRPESRADSVSPTRAHGSALRQRESNASSQNALGEPEEVEMPSVPQKRNFTPRPRRSNESFFKASAQSSAPASGAPTPPRMQLSHADIQRWQQETSNASEDSPEPSRPLLRPLPPKNASPTKSSLRSPLKPHTPGRVVEFTSSVLSPVEQAKARAQRRLSNSSAASHSSTVVKRRPQGPPPRQTANKENSAASMPSASSLAKPAGPPPLSRTAWTRQHWLFLDELLQLRRQGPYEIEYERRSDKYLGKTVKSQGEAMTLERWHLDCVDAFKAEVGGWDEAALAKRLFALILGEERRSRGVVDRRSRVVFH